MAVHSPDATARFRGSLVDDRMFAIDVTEWGLDDLLKESRLRRTPISLTPQNRCA